MFSFRANAEVRRLDMKEERERRRNIVIQEAAKERAARKENSTNNHIAIQLEEIDSGSSDHQNYPQYPNLSRRDPNQPKLYPNQPNSTSTYQDSSQTKPKPPRS